MSTVESHIETSTISTELDSIVVTKGKNGRHKPVSWDLSFLGKGHGFRKRTCYSKIPQLVPISSNVVVRDQEFHF